MANGTPQQEEIIIDLEIEGNEEVLAATKSIQQLTDANKKLRAERNAIKPVNDQAREQISKLNKQIDANTKAIKDNSSAIEKQRFNIGNYKSAIDQIIPGLGSLADGLTSVEGKITLVAGAFAGLIGLYTKSATGAKDLKRAQDLLNATFDISVNRIGASTKGLSFFEKAALAASRATANLTSNTRAESLERQTNTRIAAIELQTLRELETDRIKANAAFKRDEKEAETFRRLRDDQEASYTERLEAADAVQDKLNQSGAERINVIKKQIAALQSYADVTGQLDAEGEFIDKSAAGYKQILTYQQEISDIEEEINGKKTENTMAVRGIIKEENARLEVLRKIQEQEEKLRRDEAAAFYQAQIDRRQREAEARSEEYHQRLAEYKEFVLDPAAAAEDEANANSLKKAKALSEKLTAEDKARQDSIAEYQIRLTNYKNGVIALLDTGLFKKQRSLNILLNTIFKANKLKEIAVNAQAAAMAAYDSASSIPVVGWVLGPVAAAAAIAAGLALAAKVSGIGFEFARGGQVNKSGTFRGRTHAQGGERYTSDRGHQIEVEDGENFYVLNRSASREINYLNAMNTKHGGRNLGTPVGYAADGGQIATARAVQNTPVLVSTPAPVIVVTVEDINAGLNRKYNQVQRAKIF